MSSHKELQRRATRAEMRAKALAYRTYIAPEPIWFGFGFLHRRDMALAFLRAAITYRDMARAAA